MYEPGQPLPPGHTPPAPQQPFPRPLRVSPAAGAEPAKPGKGRAARRAAVTAVADTGVFCLACCLLLSGQVVLSVLCWFVAVIVFWSNALPSLARGQRSLADRAGGTAVVTSGMYLAAARGVARGGQVATARVGQGVRDLYENERLRQVGHDTSQRAQQAWQSERAQQLRQVGQDAAQRAQQAWQSERAQQLRDDVTQRGRQVWESQRAQQLRNSGHGAAQRGMQAWKRLTNGDAAPPIPAAGPPAPPPGGYPPPQYPGYPPPGGPPPRYTGDPVPVTGFEQAPPFGQPPPPPADEPPAETRG